jgi:predicted metal-dependent phosphoesterase TrpH
MHIHSDHSDGLWSVDKIVRHVLDIGLAGFALTDHDNFDGIDKVVSILKSRKNEVLFIAGCEFSTYLEEAGELHVLGYFSDHSYLGMADLIQEFKKSRVTRAYRMVECLKTHGFQLEADDFIKNDGIPVGRMHIARELVKKGYFPTADAVFEKVLRVGSPCYIPRKEIHTIAVIEAIKKNRGKAVLAHPSMLYNAWNWKHLDKLIKNGLDGLECRHPKISQGLAKKIEDTLPKEFILTGGSDFHGDSSQEEIGKYGMEQSEFVKIFGQFADS